MIIFLIIVNILFILSYLLDKIVSDSDAPLLKTKRILFSLIFLACSLVSAFHFDYKIKEKKLELNYLLEGKEHLRNAEEKLKELNVFSLSKELGVDKLETKNHDYDYLSFPLKGSMEKPTAKNKIFNEALFSFYQWNQKEEKRFIDQVINKNWEFYQGKSNRETNSSFSKVNLEFLIDKHALVNQINKEIEEKAGYNKKLAEPLSFSLVNYFKIKEYIIFNRSTANEYMIAKTKEDMSYYGLYFPIFLGLMLMNLILLLLVNYYWIKEILKNYNELQFDRLVSLMVFAKDAKLKESLRTTEELKFKDLVFYPSKIIQERTLTFSYEKNGIKCYFSSFYDKVKISFYDSQSSVLQEEKYLSVDNFKKDYWSILSDLRAAEKYIKELDKDQSQKEKEKRESLIKDRNKEKIKEQIEALPSELREKLKEYQTLEGKALELKQESV